MLPHNTWIETYLLSSCVWQRDTTHVRFMCIHDYHHLVIHFKREFQGSWQGEVKGSG
jgi:hypothetical protein